MSKLRSRTRNEWRKRYNEGALNVFAVLFALFPIASIGLFTFSLLSSDTLLASDPRRVTSLTQMTPSATPRLFEEPLITVTFDDGWESVYSQAAPILSEYNIQTTQYILPGVYDSHTYISLDQAKSLKGAGHEIASHTMTHPVLTTIPENDVVYQLTASKASLHKSGLVDGTMHFAAPETAVNASVAGYIKKYYASHRNTYANFSDGIDQYDINIRNETPFDQYEILAFSVKNTTTTAELNAAIDYARNNNGWLVLVYHQVDTTNAQYSVSPPVFRQQMKLVRDSNIKTATLGSVLENRRMSND